MNHAGYCNQPACQLTAGIDEALLVRWNAFFVFYHFLDHGNAVMGSNAQMDVLARQALQQQPSISGYSCSSQSLGRQLVSLSKLCISSCSWLEISGQCYNQV